MYAAYNSIVLNFNLPPWSPTHGHGSAADVTDRGPGFVVAGGDGGVRAPGGTQGRRPRIRPPGPRRGSRRHYGHGEPPACLGASAADPTTKLLSPDFETSPFTVSPTTRRCEHREAILFDRAEYKYLSMLENHVVRYEGGDSNASALPPFIYFPPGADTAPACCAGQVQLDGAPVSTDTSSWRCLPCRCIGPSWT